MQCNFLAVKIKCPSTNVIFITENLHTLLSASSQADLFNAGTAPATILDSTATASTAATYATNAVAANEPENVQVSET